MTTKTLHIGGMTCVACQNKIEKALLKTQGIENAEVNYNNESAHIIYDENQISIDEINSIIEKLDYQVLDKDKQKEKSNPYIQFAGIFAIIFILFILSRRFGMTLLASDFPLAETGMGYGMILIIGLLTSIHCIAMCGGINLSQSLGGVRSVPKNEEKTGFDFSPFIPGILYNSGRIVSYTSVGIIVGALGSVFTMNLTMQSVIHIIAGLFMMIMALNMLNIFPWLKKFNPRLPRIFTKKIENKKEVSKNPFIVGILNGFMPCGPLQAMQLYALSTGNPFEGGLSMFLFCIGTIPLMFGIGAVSLLLSSRFSKIVMNVGAILVAVMGLTMFVNGWNFAGFPTIYSIMFDRASVRSSAAESSVGFKPVIENGVQIVNSTLSPRGYPAITVQVGIPVKWTINAPPGSINSCNNRIIIRPYNIEYRFQQGDNVIEFVPDRAGVFRYSCWMAMLFGTITVVDASGAVVELDLSPRSAGVKIPTGTVAVADVRMQSVTNRLGAAESIFIQEVAIDLTDNGFEPAIIVVESFTPIFWTVRNSSSIKELVFPLYKARMELEVGDNLVRFMPQNDFDFHTGDNKFFGYVKVVDELSGINLDEFRKEVSEHETLIYPPEYFWQ